MTHSRATSIEQPNDRAASLRDAVDVSDSLRVGSCEAVLLEPRIATGSLLKTFDRFRKAVGRGAAALRAPAHARDFVPASPSSAAAADAAMASDGAEEGGHSAADGSEEVTSRGPTAADERADALLTANELLRSAREAQALELAQIWIQRDPEDVDFR